MYGTKLYAVGINFDSTYTTLILNSNTLAVMNQLNTNLTTFAYAISVSIAGNWSLISG